MDNLQQSVSALWLIEQVGAATPPCIIDVRKMPAFEASGQIVRGACWRDHENNNPYHQPSNLPPSTIWQAQLTR